MSNLTSFAYLVSSVLFILSLRGLSHPTTARRGNFYGIDLKLEPEEIAKSLDSERYISVLFSYPLNEAIPTEKIINNLELKIFGSSLKDYLVENHLICIKSLEELERNKLLEKYKLIINSLKSKKTKSFIELYCGNNALNTKELAEVVPIYL